MKRIKLKRGSEVFVEGFNDEVFKLIDTLWVDSKKLQAVASMRTYEVFWVSYEDITEVKGDD